MHFSKARCAMLVFGCVLLWILPLNAQSLYVSASEQLECFLPESTLAVMIVPHLHTTRERLQHYISTLAVIKSLQPFLQSLSIRLQEFENFSGIHFADLASIFQTSFAIALLDVEASEPLHHAGWTFPEVLLAAEVTNSVEALQHLLEKVIRRHLLLRTPSVEFQIKTTHEVTLWIVSNSQFQLAYTFLDHIFLLATNPEFLERLIAARQPAGKHKPSNSFTPLFNADVYDSARQAITQYHHDVRLFVNVRQLWRKLHETFHHDCTSSSAAETQKNSLRCVPPPLRSFTWLFSLKEHGGHERIFWEMDCQNDQPTASDCMLWFHLQPPENIHLLSDQRVPANVIYYRAWHFDSSEWWQRWQYCMNSFLADSDQEEFTFQIEKLEQILQLRMDADILPAIGKEIAFACDDPSRWFSVRGQERTLEHFPCFLLIRVNQRERIEHLIQSITAIPLSQTTIQGMPVYQLDVPGNIPPLRLYAAVIDDFLTIASSQRRLQQIISVGQQGGSLASLPEYAALSALFAKECYAKSYLNLRHFLQRAGLLPPSADGKASALPAFLTGFLSITTNGSAGMMTESFSMPGGTLLVTGLILYYVLGLW